MQWLLDGVRKLEAHNLTLPEAQRRYLVLNFVNTDDGPRRVKEIMPKALVCFRRVFSTHDPSPRTGGWHNGQDWFNRLWPTMAHQTPYVDYFIFENEWFGNRESDDEVKRFVKYNIELMDALPLGVHCTVGNWSIGCPGYPTIPEEENQLRLMRPMFEKTIEAGNAVGAHFYSPEYNPDRNVFGDGAVDMSVNRDYNFMRWETYAKPYPDLIIIGTEGSNAGKDRSGREGIFRPDTPRLWRDSRHMIQQSPYRRNFRGVAWWWWGDGNTHQNAEADWSKDDFSSAHEQFFDMLLTG